MVSRTIADIIYWLDLFICHWQINGFRGFSGFKGFDPMKAGTKWATRLEWARTKGMRILKNS